MNFNAKEQIKALTALKGLNITKLADILTSATGRKYTLNSLSKRINRGSITYNEVMQIADLLDFDVNFTSRI
ncbi:hypothetical protein J6N69_01900 [bacterium]|nr:hypothetical protein [bacterium]MBP3846935.1 hypothetical protein [bacterium]